VIASDFPVFAIAAISSAPTGCVCSHARSSRTAGLKPCATGLRGSLVIVTGQLLARMPAIEACRRAKAPARMGHTCPAPGVATGSLPSSSSGKTSKSPYSV
jgi:hypothetical protein